jgi:F0F1-type ATP synthase delta subunit
LELFGTSGLYMDNHEEKLKIVSKLHENILSPYISNFISHLVFVKAMDAKAK